MKIEELFFIWMSLSVPSILTVIIICMLPDRFSKAQKDIIIVLCLAMGICIIIAGGMWKLKDDYQEMYYIRYEAWHEADSMRWVNADKLSKTRLDLLSTKLRIQRLKIDSTLLHYYCKP